MFYTVPGDITDSIAEEDGDTFDTTEGGDDIITQFGDWMSAALKFLLRLQSFLISTELCIFVLYCIAWPEIMGQVNNIF